MVFVTQAPPTARINGDTPALQILATRMSVSSTPAKISIHSSLTGWRVQIDGVINDMIYRSGADAEASARSLGEALAAEGRSVEIQLFLRDSNRAARVVCAPQALAQVSWETDTAPQR